MYNVVSTLVPSFLIGSSSFLQVARPAIKSLKSWMGLKFGMIGAGSAGLYSYHKSLDEFRVDPITD